jgi:hypothetical protein
VQRMIVGLFLGAAVVATIPTPASAASAATFQCHGAVVVVAGPDYFGGKCTGANPGFLAWARCQTPAGQSYLKYGPWRVTGTSYAYCDGNDDVIGDHGFAEVAVP